MIRISRRGVRGAFLPVLAFLSITLVVISVQIPGAPAEDSTQMRVDPATVVADLNADYTIYVEVADVTDLYAWEFQLDYDETILDLTSVSTVSGGLNEPTQTFYDLTDETNGHLWWAVASRYPVTTGINHAEHAIFEIQFHTIAAGVSDLDLYGTILVDSQSIAISHTAVDGSIDVGERVLESCDSLGTAVDEFDPGDHVYVKGAGLSPSSSYKIYIVTDYSLWTLDTTTLSNLNILVGPIDVSTDATGDIVGQPIQIWASANPGYYDIFADCQDAGTVGTYDACDAIDDLDVSDAGFFVISEYVLGTVLGLAVCIAAFAIFWRHKRARGIEGADAI